MKVKKGAGGEPIKAPDIEIDLGRGAKCIARRLDAFESAVALAKARGDLNALLAGDEPEFPWTFNEERLATLRINPDMHTITLGWMRNVIVATMSVHTLAGIELVEEIDGEEVSAGEMGASFESFELLFHDANVESRFRMKAVEVETVWALEKNGSRPAPNGRGPEELTGATNAAQTATSAQEVEEEAMPPAAMTLPRGSSPTPAADAPLQATPPEPPPAS